MKLTAYLITGTLFFACFSHLFAQPYPRVEPDRRVTFRLEAPGAQKVQLMPGGNDNGLGKGPIDMSRDEKGAWTVTIPPAVPGFHYYWFVVDGVAMNDPAARTFFGWNRDTSGIEVPDAENGKFYAINDVPHGDVRLHTYHSKVTGMWRRIRVYTPPGYDRDVKTRYPVLYLQHGSGESESGWTEQGRAQFILDNLIAEKKALPMIVVMENGMVAAGPGGRRNEAFPQVVVDELVPHIDATYRTVPARERRAIAGLSMGAGQAVQIGLAHPEMFGWVGSFSGGTMLRNAPDPEAFRKNFRLLWFGAGSVEEKLVSALKPAVEKLKASGVPAVYYEVPGTSHEWQTWRYCLLDFAPRLFRGGGK